MSHNFFLLFAVSLLVNMAFAFWGSDSDGMDDYRGSNRRSDLYDNDDRYRRNNRYYDDDDDDDSDRYIRRGGFNRRQLWQQPRRPQRSFSRFNTRTSSPRRQNSWSTSQRQPRRNVRAQSRTNRRPTQNLFRSQSRFGGNRFARAAMMYNAMDGFDMDFF